MTTILPCPFCGHGDVEVHKTKLLSAAERAYPPGSTNNTPELTMPTQSPMPPPNKFHVTLAALRKAGACIEGYNRLVRTLQGKKFTDKDHAGETYLRFAHKDPISIRVILDRNGLDDALWALRCIDNADNGKDVRLFAIWCARQVGHLMTDARSIDALAVAERYAHGQATNTELDAARDAAWAAAMDAARTGARDAARDASRYAAWAAARDAAWAAARDAARDAAWAAARDAARTGAWAAAWAAARDASRDAAWAAARDAQKNRLIEMLEAGSF